MGMVKILQISQTAPHTGWLWALSIQYLKEPHGFISKSVKVWVLGAKGHLVAQGLLDQWKGKLSYQESYLIPLCLRAVSFSLLVQELPTRSSMPCSKL